MKRWIQVAMIAGTAAGCEAGSNTDVEASIFPGTYSVISLGGQPLPALAEENDRKKRELLSSVVVFNANGTYTSTGTIRETPKPSGTPFQDVSNCTGTYTQAGNTVTIVETFVAINDECSGHTTVAQWTNGNTITFTWDGLIVVARK